MMLAIYYRFVSNDFEYTDIVDSNVYMYCQQFNSKIVASMLSCVIGNITALDCILLWQHDDNSTNFDDDFKVVGKLLTNCYSMLSYHEVANK